MDISLQKLLLKMEEQIKGARAASAESEMREKVHSIRTLCELVLEEQSEQGSVNLTGSVQPAVAWQPQIAASQQNAVIPAPIGQPKPLKTEEGANGESLFDF
ncbi:YwdI family protein [Bacillus massilinigeriensis]|uniref:YwdI family protein n=1 Tax=Bacillus mediterraneensis TaxID=1805474 RepID=UPI0008F8D06E|nr:YwdI family protein [Bacillus mediterraneensis]